MKRTSPGFSLIELLVVLTIMAIIGVFAITGFKDYARFQQYDASVATVKSTFIDARVRARSAELDQSYGVKILTSSLVVFRGSTYSAGASTNETVSLTGATISRSLTGGTDQIIFNKLTGLPSATGTITVVGVEHVATTTLTISGVGVIQ
jgi:prepilin-type N-terminal cleavage/methylation domain-containing protein